MLQKWGFEPVRSLSFTRSPLEMARAYQNPEVIDLFTSSFNISRAGAEEVFRDLLTWMWGASGRLIEGKSHIPLLLRDEFFAMEKMWRCFALFTEDYRNFCATNLGVHIDFTPSEQTGDFFGDLKESGENYKSFSKRRSDQLNFIAEEFGEITLNRWLLHYPDKYSEESLTRDKS